MEHELQTGVTDLAFLLAESIQSASLNAEPLRFERVIVVCNKNNPLAQEKDISTKELATQPIFLAKSDCGYRMVFEQMLTKENVEPGIILEFNSLEMLKACLKTSTGVAVIPEITVQTEIERQELEIVHWSENFIDIAILMIWHRDKWLSSALSAFMDTARAVMC